MRPRGEPRQALLDAATRLATTNPQGRGATLQEMANFAKVGYSTAMHTAKNMTRAGALCISGRRKVPYRNKPVAEYKPPELVDQEQQERGDEGAPDFSALAGAWK